MCFDVILSHLAIEFYFYNSQTLIMRSMPDFQPPIDNREVKANRNLYSHQQIARSSIRKAADNRQSFVLSNNRQPKVVTHRKRNNRKGLFLRSNYQFLDF